MIRNNFSHFNPRCYEEQLSPFGRKVLNTLIKKWNKDRERKFTSENVISQQTENSRPHNKVLTFSSNETIRSPLPPFIFNPVETAPVSQPHTSLVKPPPPLRKTFLANKRSVNNETQDTPFDVPEIIDACHGVLPSALTPAEVVKTIHCKQKLPNISSDNLLQTVLSNNNKIQIDIENTVVDENEKDLFVFNPYLAAENKDSAIGINFGNGTTREKSACLLKTVNVDWNTFHPHLSIEDQNSVETGVSLDNRTRGKERVCEMKTGNEDLFTFYHHLPLQNGDDVGVGVFDERTTVKESAKLKSRNIGWDDMFDTELLSDIDSTETTRDVQETTAIKENIFELHFPKSKHKTVCKPNAPESNKNKNQSDNKETKKLKRNNQLKIIDSLPKKIKKPAIKFSNQIKDNKFRKQKYTEAVKDWLNDIDPQHTIKENIDSANIIEIPPKQKRKESVISSKNVALVTTKDEIKCNEKSAKKVVQAQLANKDGVMKFEKPKKVKSKTDESVVNGITEKRESAKDKKPKSIFIAPIKSQIPVKDISYEIISINKENIENHRRNIVNNEEGEILMTVVYSNGFCQLNQQHTEDSCSAEGILSSISDHFYYCKLNILKDLIPHLINNRTIISFDGKTLLLTLLSLSIDVSSVEVVDAKIGGALLAPDNSPGNFADLQKLLKCTPQFTIATECALQKAAWYTALLRDCVTSLRSLLLEDSLWNVFVDIEMKLLPIIADMEHRGVLVDMEQLNSMESIITARMKEVETACHRVAGRPFQITSTPQVRALLYDELKLDSKTNVKIRETITKGAKSTSEAMLKTLITVHPLPKLILEYRHLHKAHTTFLTGIAQHVKDGVVKPTWDQTAAATGRIASNNPNLQAIPKAPFSLILFPGPEDEELQNRQLHFRSVYVARDGHTLLAADFQHVECRVFAHAAADAALLDALRSERDLFRVLAAKWLGKPEPNVSAADRERTKRIVYASLYGAGARKLMDILGVSYEQALCISASFNKTFPSLKGFGRAVVAQCARAGGGGRLATLGGRARRFPDICSGQFALRSHAERQAVNFVVQGSAADLCKLAMAATAAALRAAHVRARLLLQIHDELVWEVRHEDLPVAAGAVRAAMESCGARCGLALPLPVALSAGRSWGDMREYTTL